MQRLSMSSILFRHTDWVLLWRHNKSSASCDCDTHATAIILISGHISGECCPFRVISGMGDLDDVYSLKAEVADKQTRRLCLHQVRPICHLHICKILTNLCFLGQMPQTPVKNIASKVNKLQALLNAR